MIGEFLANLLTPIILFIGFPITAGGFLFEALAPFNTHSAIAFWIGIATAQGWWLVILVRSFSKRKVEKIYRSKRMRNE